MYIDLTKFQTKCQYYPIKIRKNGQYPNFQKLLGVYLLYTVAPIQNIYI